MRRILTRIESPEIEEHHWLCQEDDDTCYYVLGDYTANKGYAHSHVNDLIQNLKKPMDRQGSPEWRHKRRVIREAARALTEALASEWREYLRQSIVIPIPPSAIRDDPLYDDRLERILGRVDQAISLEVRELLVRRESREPDHLQAPTGKRNPSRHRGELELVRGRLEPHQGLFLLFDDIITSGATYIGCKRILLEAVPDADVRGLFLARCVH